jgi:hypothetical protein
MSVRYQHLISAVEETASKDKKQKPYRIMEVGVFNGSHSIQMIKRATSCGKTNVEFYGFDLFEDMTLEKNEAEIGKSTLAKEMQEVFKYLRSKTTAKIITLYKGDTQHKLPEVISTLPKMDIIFIDGGHSLATIHSDFYHAIKLAIPGKTVILLDDYYPSDMTKGCAFLVENELKPSAGFTVEVLEPEDVYADSGLVVKMVKVTVNANASNLPDEHVIPVSYSNTDVQPVELRDEGCGDGTCQYSEQPCDGGGRCQSGVEPGVVEPVPVEQVADAPIREERQELDEKLELGLVESKAVEHTPDSGDEQRRVVSDALVESNSESTTEQPSRPRRSRNKRSRAQAEAANLEDTAELQNDGQPDVPEPSSGDAE